MMIPLRYTYRSLLVRKTTTFATAFGIALVVFVLAASLMMSAGVKKTLGASGREDVAIVLRKGSDAELGSGIEDPQVSLIRAMPGVKKEDNVPIAGGEVVVVIALEKLGAEGVANVQIRGIGDVSKKLRSKATIVEGRAATPGSDEVVIGKGINGRFRGVKLGDSFELKRNRSVTVVGVFEDQGSSHESEIWIDVDTLRSTFGREGAVSSVRVLLEQPSSYDAFQLAVEQDKRLGLQAMRETKYFENQSQGTSLFIGVLGTVVAVCFSLGAIIGAVITMYASVANRQREIGTLRALGFSRFAILICFLTESVLLALLGGVLGATASLLMGSVEFSMINLSSWSEMTFKLDPVPQILGISVAAAGFMGVLGGFLPAIRASGVSPLAAMRG
jgi:putative ABC transport system permease protein